MLQYKTICLPLSQKKGIKAKEYYRSLISIENVTKAMEPVSATIQSETMAGWSLHSISSVPIRTARKKSIREFLFGWIPLNGPAVASFVTAFFVALFIVSIILGIVGLKKAKTLGSGKGFAIAGIVLSVLCVIDIIVMIVIFTQVII